MNRVTKTILALIGIAAVLALAHLALSREAEPAPEQEAPSPNLYTSDAYGVSFEVPDGLYLVEREAGTPERPQLAVVMVEDTEENRAVFAGLSEPREGPTSITVDAYLNPDGLGASEWVQQSTNWSVRTGETSAVQVAGNEGVSFSWDGLYQGRSVIVTRGQFAYVFSVTWLTEEDRLLAEFDEVLNSVVLQ